jgi:hypothetical protein
MTTALEEIAEARDALHAGHSHARIIKRAMLETLDPEVLEQLHQVAEEGMASAGRLRRRLVWDDILNQIEIRERQPKG